MTLVEIRDRDEIASFLRRRPAVHAYELGDLDDFFWPHTRWLAWQPNGEIEQIALLYDEPDPPVLLAFAEENADGMSDLLQSLAPGLPPRVYAHLSPNMVSSLAPDLVPANAPAPHRKLGLVDRDRLALYARELGELLGPDDLREVEAFYAVAYPGTWFHARMLDTRRYLGIRRDGVLVCIAGVHVWSPTWGVATLGNVATLPEARGAGLATAACAELCRLLLADGIDVISLNVRADNAAAIRAYENLGFEQAADYVEVTLEAGDVRATGDVGAA